MSSIRSLPNLGPASETAFAKIGITTAEQLAALGADPAYRQLLLNGARPHFIGYYVLHMALQGRPWNDCKGAEKTALRRSFDGMVKDTHARARTELEAALNLFGVIPAPTRPPPLPDQKQKAAPA